MLIASLFILGKGKHDIYSMSKEIDEGLKNKDSKKQLETLQKMQGKLDFINLNEMLKNFVCSDDFAKLKDNVREIVNCRNKVEEGQKIFFKSLQESRQALKQQEQEDEWNEAPVEGAKI